MRTVVNTTSSRDSSRRRLTVASRLLLKAGASAVLPFRRSWKAFAASILVLGLVAVVAPPASATTVELSGTQGEGTVVHLNTKMHDAHAENSVYLAEDENNAGGVVVIGLRGTDGKQFASGTASGTTFRVVYNNNGEPYQPEGYFYINTRATGRAVEAGRAT